MRQKRRPAVEKICAHCGRSYRIRASHADGSTYCSNACKDDGRRTRPKNDPRPCVVCGAVFMPSRAHGNAQYCSKSCIWKATRGPEFNARISRETVAARATKQRRTGKLAHTYIKFGGRHEHRVVAEKKLGRALRRGEIVHHIDGNPKNNDPNNLMVITQRQHMIEHGLGIKGGPSGAARITPEDARRIREMALYGGRNADIAAAFRLSVRYISAIIHRRTWVNV